ncbi:glycosyltransferase family 4 protein [Paraclostridium bifermentans]|uniref:glycosyltransferase family 4 protein n=1 Tax=Paraclostridium bifermentans TaxID=1490 RepID=UPI00374E5000
MKKVMIISETLEGGVRKHISDLLKEIDKNKYKLYVLYNPNRIDDLMSKSINESEFGNVEFISSKYLNRPINLKKDIKAFVEIHSFIRKIKPDVVHCHSSKAGAIGRVSAKLNNINHIYYTPHAYVMQNPNISKVKYKIFLAIEKLLSKFCTKFTINVSEGERNFAIKSKVDKSEKFKVIYNGLNETTEICNMDYYKKKFGINEGNLVIGVCGRLDSQKDPLTFLKIAKSVLELNQNITFLYIGDGELKKEANKFIIDNDMESNVLLTGFSKDVEKIIQIIDIYLITSLYEGLPYSLIEALKYKLPIVATDTIGNNEIVIDGKNGLLFKVGNIEEGTEKVIKLIEDNDERTIMGKNSYKFFKKNFLISDMISNIQFLYDLD